MIAGVPRATNATKASPLAVARGRICTLNCVERTTAHVFGDRYHRLRPKLRALRRRAATARNEVENLRASATGALTSIEAAFLVPLASASFVAMSLTMAILVLLEAGQYAIPYLDTLGMKINRDLLSADIVTRIKVFTGVAFACTAVVSIFLVARTATKLCIRTVSELSQAQVLLLEALTALALAAFTLRALRVLADLREFYASPGTPLPESVFLFLSLAVPVATALVVQGAESLFQRLFDRLLVGRNARRALRRAWFAKIRSAAAVANSEWTLARLWRRADRALKKANSEALRASRFVAWVDSIIERSIIRCSLTDATAPAQVSKQPVVAGNVRSNGSKGAQRPALEGEHHAGA